MTKAPLENYFSSRRCVLLTSCSEIDPISNDIFLVEGVITECIFSAFFSVIKLDSWKGPIVVDFGDFELGDKVKVFGFLRQNWNPDFRSEQKFELAMQSIKAVKLA